MGNTTTVTSKTTTQASLFDDLMAQLRKAGGTDQSIKIAGKIFLSGYCSHFWYI